MTDTENLPDDFANAFETAFARLQVDVLAACEREEEWQAKVAAAIYAALDFAASEPTAARVLTLDALIERLDGPRRYARLIEYFAELLGAEAPRKSRLPLSTEQALVGAIVVLTGDHLRADKLDRLVHAGPELVELTLLPYLDATEARRWAAETAPSA